MKRLATVRIWSSRGSLVVWSAALGLGLFVVDVPTASARPRPIELLEIQDQLELPYSAPELGSEIGRRGAIGDTIYFGFVDEDGFAIEGETWTWDHGSADVFEGWTLVDLSPGSDGYTRHLTAESWNAGGNVGAVPVLNGAGSAWIGLNKNEADDRCWLEGTGYGNSWDQFLRSPVFTWNGIDSITLSFMYFNDTEDDFDYTCVQLRHTNGDVVDLECFTGQDGIAGDDPPTGQFFSVDLTGADFGSSTTFEILFSMTSDGGWSDEDGQYATEFGPFGLDDVVLTGGIVEGSQHFEFETGLEGWTPGSVDGANGDGFLVVRDVGTYDIPPGDLDDCAIETNVLAFHDENEQHDKYTAQMAISPPVNLAALEGGYDISAEYNIYSASPAGEIFYRIGWDYYPFLCEVTGRPIWSGRVGQATFFSGGPGCFEGFNDQGVVPAGAEQVRLIFEIVSGCGPEGEEPECSENSDFSPILDNVRIRAVLIDDPADVPLPDLPTPQLRTLRSTPNPFGTSTTLSYAVVESGPVTLTINDASGRRVRTLVEGLSEPGVHSRVWDGTDDSGRSVPKGVYWSRLESESEASSLRMVRIE